MKINRLLLSLALLSALLMTACDNEHPEVDIRLERDYSEVIRAIGDSNRSLADKLALVEAAVNDGSDLSLLKLVQAALSSLSGTLEGKLTAIQKALQAGTSSLETKMALIEATLKSGFADYKSRQALMLQALQSLNGTAEEKLAAMEAAVKSQASTLESKLALIETAVKNGFADTAQSQELLLQAVQSLSGTLEEKLAAVGTAITDVNTPLESKLALLETAIRELFADAKEETELMQQAVASLQGTMEEKLAAIESVMGSGTTGLDTKLDLIAAALEQGIGDRKTAIQNLQTALDTAVPGLNTTLSEAKSDIIEKLTDISGCLITDALAMVFKAIADTIDTNAQSEEEVLDAIGKAVAELQASLAPTPAIEYVGDPTQAITVTSGETFSVVLSLVPASEELAAESLRIVVVAGEKCSFSIKSSQKSQSAQGQYDVQVTAQSTSEDPVDAAIAFVYNYGSQDEANYLTTNPFRVIVNPQNP